MRYSAVTLAAGATAAVLAYGMAQAGEVTLPVQPGAATLGIGVGVICDTTEQAKNFVALRSGGAELSLAVNKVNAQAQDPRACGVAAVAFQRGQTVGTGEMQGKLVSIVRIQVIGGYDGESWKRVPGTILQYAIIEEDGLAI